MSLRAFFFLWGFHLFFDVLNYFDNPTTEARPHYSCVCQCLLSGFSGLVMENFLPVNSSVRASPVGTYEASVARPSLQTRCAAGAWAGVCPVLGIVAGSTAGLVGTLDFFPPDTSGELSLSGHDNQKSSQAS